MFRFWNQIIAPLLDILSPKEILEIGVDTLQTPLKLAEHARAAGGRLTVIDRFSFFDSTSLLRTWKDVVQVNRSWNVDDLSLLPHPDFVLIDGDHNWHAVFHQLIAIEALAVKSGKFPVTLIHDVGWPYARRDAYARSSMIPPECLQPFTAGGVLPGTDRLIAEGGINERAFHAVKSGGPHNGVLTAVEDYLKQTTFRLSATMVEGFHGLMILVPHDRLADNERLRELLASFTTPAPARAHIAALEAERIQNLLLAKDLRYSLEMLRGQRDSYRQAKVELCATIDEKNREIARRERTLSWRITAPLRETQRMLRRMMKKGIAIGWFGTVWRSLGQPMPGFARWVRHTLLGTVFPAAPSPDTQRLRQATEVNNRYGGAVSVSVIVTARNNGEFLRECLQSILSQTVKPMEIIYCDDGSNDNSLQIASSMFGIRILSLEHQGVIAARNAAVRESKGDLLLHIDGDDMIPPEYLTLQLQALAKSNDAAFAFSGAQRFGLQDEVSTSDWDPQLLWTRNFINTSALVRRSAFEAAGGWRDVAGTLWDWDLWLRISRIGPGVASGALLHYRRHAGSWSQYHRRLAPDDVGLLYGRIRRAVAKVSVCAIVSGRLPELMDTWIDALVATIKASESAVNPPELIILDNSKDGMRERINKALEKHPGVFRTVTVVPYPVRFTWTSEMERRHMVSKFLATAYNRIFAMADGEIVWFLEDDIVVPECAYETLLKDLTDGEIPPAAVSGLYRARHMDQLVAHHVVNGVSIPVKDQHLAPLDIDLGGTGCMMALRPFITHPFTSHWRGSSPAHDWAWCDEIRKDGRRIILDPRVRCRHHQTLTEFV